VLEELEPSDHGLSGSYHYNGAAFNCFRLSAIEELDLEITGT